MEQQQEIKVESGSLEAENNGQQDAHLMSPNGGGSTSSATTPRRRSPVKPKGSVLYT